MNSDEKKDYERNVDGGSEDETIVAIENGAVVNASGYKDQLKRQYGLLGLAGIALTVDNAWIALGSSISVSIRESFPFAILTRLSCLMTYTTSLPWKLGCHADHELLTVNGGPPGIIFGLIVALFYYSFIGLGLAEVCTVPTHHLRANLC
jgi:choline transport protein